MGSEGNTKRATVIITAGNILNIVLDPILIFNLKMGMLGAGIATMIGCGLSLILFIYTYSIRRDTLVEFHLKGFKIDMGIIKEIIILAIPLILDGVILSLVGILITYSSASTQRRLRYLHTSSYSTSKPPSSLRFRELQRACVS